MITQAYFENIQQEIKKELLKAKKSILVVVAWFTDTELYQVLCDKANEGCSVTILLLNDNINTGKNALDFKSITNAGGEILLIDNKSQKNIMHNKFCVIDDDIVITGSYNWTMRAKQNDENITISKESKEFANEFLITFYDLKRRYSNDVSIDINTICKRLEILRNTIAIQDEGDIEYQLKRLQKLLPEDGYPENLTLIKQIIDSINTQSYSETIRLIDSFLQKFQTLAIYIDPELSGLNLEIKSLELQISSLQDEKSEMEKLIYAFEIKHNLILGELIIKILELQTLLAKKNVEANPLDKNAQKEFSEAEEEYKSYKGNYEQRKELSIYELNEKEQIELKMKFRKASKLCHPDVVNELFKEEAEKIFSELKMAFDQNDLKRINEILEYLENGKPLKAKHETITKKDIIKVEVAKFHQLRSQLLKEVTELKNSETYKTITEIDNWDEYFNETKEQLIRELNRLKAEYEKED